jgi:mono/diheme cytochrome c family protein
MRAARIPGLLLAAALTAAIASCGGGSGSGATVSQRTATTGAVEAPSAQQPLSAAEMRGRDEFVSRCGSCHTLAAAGTIGQIGPDLGDIAVNEADIRRAIRIGGGHHSHGAGGRTGNMPRNLVTGEDARDVAKYVAANASGSETP